MYYIINIFYLLHLVCSYTLKIGGTVDLESQHSFTISGLTKKVQPARRAFRHVQTTASTKDEEIFQDGAFISDSIDESSVRNMRSHHKGTKTTTPFTTKYERGTTRRHKTSSLKEQRRKNHKRKSISSLTRDLVKEPKAIRTGGDYVYTFVNNTIHADGVKRQRVILYNETHYLQYTGSVIPTDYVQLYKLWTEQSSAQVFDNEFKPPWWMEWHKPPWWMSWHTPPPVLRNDTWEIWNQPGLVNPEPPILISNANKPYDFINWFGDIWGKVKQTKTKYDEHIECPQWARAGGHVYINVKKAMNDDGVWSQRITLYNKTHYFVYRGSKIPADYTSLCKLWSEQTSAKPFDEEFSLPRWTHNRPSESSSEASSQTEVKRSAEKQAPVKHTGFDFSKWMGRLWTQFKNDHIQISSWKKIDRQAVVTKQPSIKSKDFIYTYVNNSLDNNGVRRQQIFIYNKSHYVPFGGEVMPANYLELTQLWSELNNAKEFDDVFKPPWWMQWHKPPWWMEWHTPPPGLLRNDTWEIWNQPGMVLPEKVVPTNVYVPFDLIKWLKQLWNRVINVNDKTPEKNNNLSFTVPELWLQQVNKTRDRPHKRWQRPHKIKDDRQINSFTKYILNSTLKLFQAVKERAPEHFWKRSVKDLETNYKSKFREYLRSIKDQEIKPESGIKQVIFDAIEASDRIVTKLVESATEDLETKHSLRHSRTPRILHKEIKKELKDLLDSACHGLGVCKPENGFVQFVLDFTDALLKVDDDKFTQAFGALVDAIKKVDFEAYPIGEDTVAILRTKLNAIEKQSPAIQRALVMIIKNIIENRNSALTKYIARVSTNIIVSATLAFQEIVNKLDEKVTSNHKNVKVWDNIRRDMNKWVKGKGPAVEGTMGRFVTYIRGCIDGLDSESFNLVMENTKLFLG